jgi:hypothetical protein
VERRPKPDSPDSTDLGAPSNDREQQPVPRLPRGSGVHLSGQAIIRILMFAALLVGVIMLREPCSRSVASFVGQFETGAGTGGDAGAPGQELDQAPGQAGDQASPLPPGNYVRITGDMSEQELEQALRQAGVAFDDAGTLDAGVPDATPR